MKSICFTGSNQKDLIIQLEIHYDIKCGICTFFLESEDNKKLELLTQSRNNFAIRRIDSKHSGFSSFPRFYLYKIINNKKIDPPIFEDIGYDPETPIYSSILKILDSI